MAFSTPLHLDANGVSMPLERVKFGVGDSDGRFSESWLQDLLFKHPQAIPFRDVDPGLGGVIPVCREMSTPAGPIDLLFITRTGKIVLVETKLYRNPEARRAVIGQILDYAKELTSWKFEQLAARVASATGKGPTHLLDLVRAGSSDFDDAQFVDSVNRSLERADMTLLIIGDGIQSGAEALIGFLEKHGGLQFSFGLIEVAVFLAPNGGRFVQPRVLAKTEILRRTLLVAPDGASLQESAGDAIGEADEGQTWLKVFWTDFVNRLRLDDITQPVPPKAPRGTNIYYPMPPSGSVAWVSAFVASAKQEVGVYLVLSASFVRFKEVFAALEAQKQDIEREIGMPLVWQSGRSYTVTARRSFRSLDRPEERGEVLGFMTATTNRFVNAFRPRLTALLREE